MQKHFFLILMMVAGLFSTAQTVSGRSELPLNPASDPKAFVNPVTDFTSACTNYFIYNEAAAQYLTQGSSYGTRAALVANNPKSFKIEKEDVYYFLKINNNQANSIENIYGLVVDGGSVNNVYTDGKAAANTAGYNRWTIEEGSAAGRFTIASYYHSTMADSTFTDRYFAPDTIATPLNVYCVPVEDNSIEWQFYPADIITLYGWLKEADASLATTPDNSLETAYEEGITAFNSKNNASIRAAIQALRAALGRNILNAGFDNATIDEWSFSGSNNRNDVGRGYGAAEIYQKIRNLYQNIPNLPAGNYILKAQAFRADAGASTGQAFLYAGENELQLPLKTGSENNMQTGAASFEAGVYPVELEFIHPEAGDIVIGINSKDNRTWMMFDSFELEYTGAAASLLTASVAGLAFDQLNTEIIFNLNGININGNVQIVTDVDGLAVPASVAVSGATSTTPVTATYSGTGFNNVEGTVTITFGETIIELPVKIVSETFVPDEGNLIPGNGYMNSFTGFSGWGTKSLISVLDEPVYSGISCAKITGSALGYPNGGTLDADIEWKPNTLYKIRAMVKTGDGDFNIGVSNTYVDGVKDTNYKIDNTNGEWAPFETTFLTGPNAVAGLLYFNNDPVNATTIIAYIDNYELFEVPAVDPAPFLAALQTANESASAYYDAINPADVAEAEAGEEVTGKYSHAAYTALATAIAAAENILATPGDYTIEEIVEATSALAAAQSACIIYIAKNSLPEGDYYIKKAGSDLYWSNMKAITSEEKPEFTALYSTNTDRENIDEQLWTITLDGGRYKIVNIHLDEYPAGSGNFYHRFITEKGTFPQLAKIETGYLQAWNTFDLFFNGAAYAVQRTGSASHHFWRLDENNYVIWPSLDRDDATDFIFEFVDMNTALAQAIATGQEKLDAAVTGNSIGQYSQGIYDAFSAALTAAAAAVSAGTATAADLLAYKDAEALFVPNVISGINTSIPGKLIVTSQKNAIKVLSPETNEISVYNLTGVLVYRANVSGETVIPVTPGAYLVKAANAVVKVLVK